jgi:HlyD family secretion protein
MDCEASANRVTSAVNMNRRTRGSRMNANPIRSRRKRNADRQVLAFFLGLFLLAGCTKPDPNRWQGYVEAEFLRVAAPLPGALESLKVKRGDSVKAGQELFQLECAADLATQREANERLQQAKARLENLKKGQRPTELSAIEARLAQAKAALELSQTEFKRFQELVQNKVASAAEFDRAQTALTRDQRLVEEIAAQLATASLGARSDDIRAAEADVAAVQASLARSEWNVAQKQQAATEDALVFDTLYTQGEWVPAGAPIVALLPPRNLKVRFFVPQTRIGILRIGQSVSILLDGVTEPYGAKISYLSPQAEYTPPVIYSQENRAKLVFMVEAWFDSPDPARLHPGQPVDVVLKP